MIDLKKIFPLSEFQTSKKLRQEILDSNQSYLLTSNGRPCFVVQNIRSFQKVSLIAE